MHKKQWTASESKKLARLYKQMAEWVSAKWMGGVVNKRSKWNDQKERIGDKKRTTTVWPKICHIKIHCDCLRFMMLMMMAAILAVASWHSWAQRRVHLMLSRSPLHTATHAHVCPSACVLAHVYIFLFINAVIETYVKRSMVATSMYMYMSTWMHSTWQIIQGDRNDRLIVARIVSQRFAASQVPEPSRAIRRRRDEVGRVRWKGTVPNPFLMSNKCILEWKIFRVPNSNRVICWSSSKFSKRQIQSDTVECNIESDKQKYKKKEIKKRLASNLDSKDILL